MNYLRHAGINSNRGISAGLWRDAPIDEVLRGYKDGVYFADDFEKGAPILATAASAVGVVGQYRGFTSDGGYIADSKLYGGVLELGSDGNNEGASFQGAAAPFQISLSNGDLWYEARIKVAALTDSKAGLFLGLAESATLSATVPIAENGTLADINLVGFHRLEGDGDKLDFVYKANGVAQVNTATDAVTLVADTWIKVGMRFRTKTGKLSFFINGVEQSTTKTIPSTAGDDFPNDVALAPIVGLLNAAAEANKAYIDWVRVLQLDAGE